MYNNVRHSGIYMWIPSDKSNTISVKVTQTPEVKVPKKQDLCNALAVTQLAYFLSSSVSS